jgi:hypothetical protein
MMVSRQKLANAKRRPGHVRLIETLGRLVIADIGRCETSDGIDESRSKPQSCRACKSSNSSRHARAKSCHKSIVPRIANSFPAGATGLGPGNGGLSQFATTLVNPPTAVPANAAKAEMTEAFMERSATGARSRGATPAEPRRRGEPPLFLLGQRRGASEIRHELRCPERYDQNHCVCTRKRF